MSQKKSPHPTLQKYIDICRTVLQKWSDMPQKDAVSAMDMFRHLPLHQRMFLCDQVIFTSRFVYVRFDGDERKHLMAAAHSLQDKCFHEVHPTHETFPAVLFLRSFSRHIHSLFVFYRFIFMLNQWVSRIYYNEKEVKHAQHILIRMMLRVNPAHILCAVSHIWRDTLSRAKLNKKLFRNVKHFANGSWLSNGRLARMLNMLPLPVEKSKILGPPPTQDSPTYVQFSQLFENVMWKRNLRREQASKILQLCLPSDVVLHVVLKYL